MISVRHLAIMQGRLLPPVDGRIQAFPREHWEQEFPRAAAAGLNAIEWIYDTYGVGANPLETAAGVARIVALSAEHGIVVHSVCADYFMDFAFVRAADAERAARLQHLEWLLGQADSCMTVGALATLVNVLGEAQRAPRWFLAAVRGRARRPWKGFELIAGGQTRPQLALVG